MPPVRVRRRRSGFPDLATQLESLLDSVWRCERMWQLEDRIDGQIKFESRETYRRRRARVNLNSRS
jgi:hypothetical protein